MTDSTPKPRRQFTVRSIFVWITATAIGLAILRMVWTDTAPLVIFSSWFAVVSLARLLIGPKVSWVLSIAISEVILGIPAWQAVRSPPGPTAADFIGLFVTAGLLGLGPPILTEVIIAICQWVEREPNDENVEKT